MRSRWFGPMLLLLALLAGTSHASATLLFAGGEDVDFTCFSGGSCITTTNSLTIRSGWARASYGVSATSTDPPSNYFSTAIFTANSTIWVHAQLCANPVTACSSGTTANAQMLRIVDNVGNPALIIRGTGTAGQVKISSRTSSGTFTDIATCTVGFPTSSIAQMDFFINYGTSGQVTLYANSMQICNFSGNVTNGDGATTLQQVQFAGTSGSTYWSEVIVATTDTRAMARYTASTAGNGNTTGFSGTNICSAIWNVTSFNDSNFGYSGSNSVLQECTVNSSIAPGVYSVLGLVMSARALVGSTGPQHFDFLTRTANTDYASGDFAPTTSFSNITNYIQTVNPSTSNPWAVSDFQAAGFNVGEKTKP